MSKTQKNRLSRKPVFIVGLIHAKWCPHCVNFMPEWKKLKGTTKDAMMKKGGRFEELEDSEENREQKMKSLHPSLIVNGGYPTIFKIVGGELEYYNGERNANAMRNWTLSANIQKESEPDYSESNHSERGFLGRLFGGYMFKKSMSKASKASKTSNAQKNKLRKSQSVRSRLQTKKRTPV